MMLSSYQLSIIHWFFDSTTNFVPSCFLYWDPRPDQVPSIPMILEPLKCRDFLDESARRSWLGKDLTQETFCGLGAATASTHVWQAGSSPFGNS